MTQHDHAALVDGCFRCELGRDEVEGLLRDEREYSELTRDWDFPEVGVRRNRRGDARG